MFVFEQKCGVNCAVFLCTGSHHVQSPSNADPKLIVQKVHAVLAVVFTVPVKLS